VTEFEHMPGLFKAFCSKCGTPLYARSEHDPNDIRVRLGGFEGDLDVVITGPRKMWGGKITENIVQALSRDIIVDCMIGIHLGLGYRTALQVYDEVVLVVPTPETERVVKAIFAIMTRSPKWLPELPVGVEVNHGPTYGDC
jgi:hypothetical protein